MSTGPLYLNIVRILSERRKMPIALLAIKTGTTTTHLIDSLRKLEKVQIVSLNEPQGFVQLAAEPNSIPPMSQIYAIAN